MFNVCYNCGLYCADKIIDPVGPFAVCPECGHRHPFLALPLMIVSGASGAGKSTVCNYLTGRAHDAVLLDADILWRSEFSKPEDNYRDFFDTWLRMAKNIGQSGRPVVLFGAGIGVPHNLEGCVERRYFSAIHYLSLVCDDDVLTQRLKQRPNWRQSSGHPFIEEQLSFNRWFREYNQTVGQPPITLVDTGTLTLEESARTLVDWMAAIL
ncbi:MAG: AAA family ATPase [Caldilineaceae bacterium]|nr:AAA family ATPase [Caldilineaceae bacterium]